MSTAGCSRAEVSGTRLPEAHKSSGGHNGLWSLAALASAAFVLIVGLLMIFSYARAQVEDPLHSLQLKELKAKLRDSPADEKLKGQIRTLDLRLRGTYFTHISRMSTGVWMLLGGAAALVLASTKSRNGRKQLPQLLGSRGIANAKTSTAARWAVAVAGGLCGAFLLGIGTSFSTALPKREADIDQLLGGNAAGVAVAATRDAASTEELRRNWIAFRGWEGAGYMPGTNFADRWDPESGTGIVWKVSSDCAGFNSPIVWQNKVFMSGGDAKKREVICLDAGSGKILWRTEIVSPAQPSSASSEDEIPESTGYAAASMTTDGRRVYVIFANGDVAGLSMDGKVLWAKNFGPFSNAYGHATSLATWSDKLILQLDQGESEQAKSKLYAIDGKTGNIAWQKPRKYGASWASPVAFEAAGKPQIVVLSLPHAKAYDANDGKELWQADLLNGEVTPSPLFAAGMVLVASPSDRLVAVRPDGQGDITKTHVAWKFEDSVPDVTSPASNGELVFVITTSGIITCLDIKDGKKQWEHDLEMECHATPAVAGNRVYFFTQKGTAVVVEAARQFKEVFRTQMPDEFHASPALVDGRIYVRGVTNVWCLGKGR